MTLAERRSGLALLHLGPALNPILTLLLIAGAALPPLRAAVALDPALARMPVIERIVSAPVFEEPLTWVGDGLPDDEESEALWAAIDLMRQLGPGAGFEAIEAFIEAYPDSVWTPSLRCNLAFYYREWGRNTLALEHWAAAWDATAEATDLGGKRVADFTLAHWTRLLASLGRAEALTVLFAETEGRMLDGGPLQERMYATQESYRRMISDPAVAYRCGTLAVVRLARELALPNTDLSRVKNAPAPGTGFSLAELHNLATDAGLPVVPLRRPDGDDRLMVPSAVHWRQNHYAALVEVRDDYILVDDPTFGDPRWLHIDVINAEASGYFLALPSRAPGSWSRVPPAEASQVFGGGYPSEFDDNDDETCPKTDNPDMEESDESAPINAHDPNGQSECEECPLGGAGEGEPCEENADNCSTCPGKGLAVWRVSEPYISLWILDTPLYYTTSHGKRTAFTLTYKQRNTRPLEKTWGLGPRWESSRLAYVRYDSGSPYRVSLYAAQGGMRVYTPDGVTRHYRSNTYMSLEQFRYMLRHGTGGASAYGYPFQFYVGVTNYFQTEQIDKRNRTTQLQYSVVGGVVRLNTIIDPDGRTNTLTYSPSFPQLLTQVTDPYGRAAKFYYNATNALWKIEDAQGHISEFTYAADGRLNTLITPYGTTAFTWSTDVPFGPYSEANRTLLVTEPGGRKHFYVYRNSSWYLNETPPLQPLLPDNYPANQMPNTAPYSNMINDYSLALVNSFYWGPGQYAGLSTGFKNSPVAANLTLADYKLARSRNWLLRGQYGEQAGGTLNLERQPSPNGVLDGQKIWYDYEGKLLPDGHWWEGTQSNPQLVAMVLPDGSTRYTRYTRNGWGLPTQVTSTYTSGGGVSTRTTTHTYDASGRKLVSISGPDGQLRVGYTYDTQFTNLIKTITRYHAAGQGYTTTYNYNPSTGRLDSRVSPTGLTTTYGYTGGFLTSVTDSPVARTESFTYDKGNVASHTDYLGLTRTFTWNNLQLLTRIGYNSDSTSETNVYTTLDRTSHTDRRGKTTAYGYNGVRQLISQTDPLNRVTIYDYCDCGSLGFIIDPLTNTTVFLYDYTGRRTQVQLPGGATFTYAYNLPGHMTSATDSLGTWTATYNNQGLLATIRNPANQTHLSVTYNADDQPTSVTDAQNIVTTRTFDYLGRVLTRKQGTLPNEVFTYTARGLTNHTDQLGKVTKYTLDAALRKTAEITPNTETVSYTHNAAGNVLTLTDHRGKTTTWTYDAEGRMLTKKYHGQTFTNLQYSYYPGGLLQWRKFWSSTSVNRQTSYGYDSAGNLTNITYPAGTPSVTFGYNGRNQLTSMSDATFGATTFDYAANGLLTYEQGPWTSNRVSFAYNNALLRSQLTLQQPSGSWVQNYGYNSSRRLTSLTAPSLSATPFAYYYLGASRRVTQITFPNSGKVTNSYDTLARLTATRLRRQDNTELNKHEYLYNDRHERTKHTRMDNSYVNFGYDPLGQLTNAPGYTSGGTPIANEQLRYTYDGGWNMTARTENGVGTSYVINDRNQVTSAGGKACSFDMNGNLTNRVYDATGPKTYNYFYDDENRLIEARTDTNSTPTASRWRSTWVYDGLSRARIKTDYTWSGSTWAVAGETRYVYDGRRVIQERNSSNTPTVTYTRGPDLSGSLEGAGGIGGLLARSHGYSAGTWSSHNYYHADGGGNITAMLDNHATAAAVSATYRYDPYGRLLSWSVGLGDDNVYRFSSKEFHPKSGMYYYGFRFYDPTLQRWLNRDPDGRAIRP
jgi:RHS repeat-associated protein